MTLWHCFDATFTTNNFVTQLLRQTFEEKCEEEKTLFTSDLVLWWCKCLNSILSATKFYILIFQISFVASMFWFAFVVVQMFWLNFFSSKIWHLNIPNQSRCQNVLTSFCGGANVLTQCFRQQNWHLIIPNQFCCQNVLTWFCGGARDQACSITATSNAFLPNFVAIPPPSVT